MSFPRKASLTVTNACNLRCAMCGQWSQNGYVRKGVHGAAGGATAPSSGPTLSRPGMTLADWHRVVDELAGHGVSWVLVRGGEPFMLRGVKGCFARANNNANRRPRPLPGLAAGPNICWFAPRPLLNLRAGQHWGGGPDGPGHHIHQR